MRRRLTSILFAGTLAVSVAGCSAGNTQADGPSPANASVNPPSPANASVNPPSAADAGAQPPSRNLTPDERFNELYYEKLEAQENRNGIGLTKEQMLEDYDYLHRVLVENYPYIGVAKRKYGADFEAGYAQGRRNLEQCETDVDFYLEISRLIDSMKGTGHLSIYGPSIVLSEMEGYQEMLEDGGLPEDMMWYKPWVDEYLSPPVTEHAAAWNDLLGTSYVSAYDQTLEEFNLQRDGEEENVKTEMIKAGETAYVSIASFDTGTYDKDREILFSFYRQAADCDNLIIDISRNGGGSMGYYRDLIVAPNIDEDVYWLNYVFLKDGEINRRYHPDLDEMYFPLDTSPDRIREQLLGEYSGQERKKIEPFLSAVGIPPKMNRQDLEALDLYCPSLNSIQPVNGEKMFKGKIWVLVSEDVYSSSESFASFCKTTGFATLVGTRTGGDGIGSDPLLYVLPNSGIVGRYAWIYGTVQDGTGSEEFGTEPDYLSEEGETALDTCLRIIKGEPQR